MLRDLTKSEWQELMNIPDDRIPMALILRGTRDLKGHYTQMRTLFSDVLDIRDSNVVVDDVFVGSLDRVSVAYASVYGAPMASEVTHVFGVLGTRLALQIGCCGALSETLAPGDLFATSTAYCGEGASQYYKVDGKEVAASFGFSEIAEIGSGESVPIRCGKLYTTSALFTESHQDIARWRTQGFLAVNMETAFPWGELARLETARQACSSTYSLNKAQTATNRRLHVQRPELAPCRKLTYGFWDCWFWVRPDVHHSVRQFRRPGVHNKLA